MKKKICYEPIGVIHTPFHDPLGMPIQPVVGEGIKDSHGLSSFITSVDQATVDFR